MERSAQIDILKAICALLVVAIHSAYNPIFGQYIIAIARCAVPIFFIITGYYYKDIVKHHREKQQILKIFSLLLLGISIYGIEYCVLNFINGTPIQVSIAQILSPVNIFQFLLFNVTFVSGHLWYLSALLYVLIISRFIYCKKAWKLVVLSTPILLLIDLMFGKYSLVIFGREFPYIYLRNFIFVGIPYFTIGTIIRQKESNKKSYHKVWGWNICILIILNIFERFTLVSLNLNAERDQYVVTTFLAISLFVFFKRRSNKISLLEGLLAVIGKKYSTWIYILHPIVMTGCSLVFRKILHIEFYDTFEFICVYIATICAIKYFFSLEHIVKKWKVKIVNLADQNKSGR